MSVEETETTITSSPSFVGSSSTRFPEDTEAASKLHVEVDITSIFETVSPAHNKWVNLIAALLKDDGSISELITAEGITELCDATVNQLKGEPSLLNLQVKSGSSLAVVGDVHGQFSDLVHHILPLKAPQRSFLFLGDYVDRGPQSVEAVLLLFALKVEYPQHVHLLRGNHEEAQTSRIYGFFMEMMSKYADCANDLWTRVNTAFCHLPVAAVVSCEGSPKRYFCAHGGLSPELANIGLIQEIDRVDYGATLDNAATKIVDGLLWSDPVPEGSTLRYRDNERGCGFAFGPKATEDFCAENNINLVIRAHQMAMEGYAWNHGNLCLTIFSAPNYCGLSNNLGCVLLLDDKLDTSFVQYKSAPSKNSTAPPTRSLPPFFFS